MHWQLGSLVLVSGLAIKRALAGERFLNAVYLKLSKVRYHLTLHTPCHTLCYLLLFLNEDLQFCRCLGNRQLSLDLVTSFQNLPCRFRSIFRVCLNLKCSLSKTNKAKQTKTFYMPEYFAMHTSAGPCPSRTPEASEQVQSHEKAHTQCVN